MSAYRPYPKYKPSGVEWLGDVPVGWEVKRFKGILKEREERSKDGSETLLSVSAYTGVTPRSELIEDGEHLSRADSLEGYKKCYEDDLVMNIMLAWNRGLAFTKFQGIVSPAYCVFHVIDGSSPDFLNYLVRSDEYTRYFKAFSTGVIDSRLRIYPETFGSLFCHLPPLPEQIQIASFLDRECGKLDALQAKQERLIELLKEKRQALISHAVTKGLPGVASAKTGLDPTAKLKPSGIDWLGDVPEHWEVTRLKFHVSRFEQGWSPQCEGRNKEDGEIGVLKVGCVNGGIFRVEEHKALPAELEPRLQYTLKRGDLLISRANTRELVGSAAVVDRDHDDILLCDKLYRLRFHRGVSEIYLSHFLGTSEVRQQIELDATGASASMVNIGQDCIRELNLALPPLAEQRAIVAHLDEKCGKIDQLKAKAERGIELLKERRSALISAAVTGKIDVRDM